MSRPRSRSPRYRLSPRWHDDRRGGGGRGPPRNFPSDRPDFDPHWNGPRFDNHRLRPKEDPEKQWPRFREEGGPAGRRRPSGSPTDPHRHRRAPLEELRRRTPSPPFGIVDHRRLSPDHELRGRDRGRGGRGRGGFREDLQRYGGEDQQREKFGEATNSPQRLPRERLPSVLSRKRGVTPGGGGGWGREEGRSRDRSPPEMSHNRWRERERGGGEMGRGGQDRPREDHNPHHHPLHQRERSPFPDMLRKEMEDGVHRGYGRDKEPLRDRHGSLDKRPPGGGFGGGHRGPSPPPLREGGAPGTLIVEHDHGMADGRRKGPFPLQPPPQREPFGEHPREHGDRTGQDGRERSTGATGSSQERFRVSDRRSKVREAQEEEERVRGRPVHDNRRDLEFFAGDPGGTRRERGERFGDDGTRQHSVRRSPPPPPPPPMRQGRHNSPVMGFHGQEARMEVPPRGRHSPPGPGGRGRNPGRGGRLEGPPGSRDRTQGRLHYYPQQGPQHRPREDYGGSSPRGEDWDQEPRDEHPLWGGDAAEPPPRHWESLDGGARRLPPQREDLRRGSRMPRQRQAADECWNAEQPETMATEKDRLTIKVDLNRTTGQSSQLCYSTDRQLSLDLVNVGRQRLDFLPMLEHSGTYRENATHTGTFAQEIITLVHHVKDHYFRGNGITLNQRFSGPQEGGLLEDEEEEDDEEEMVEERLTLNRRFNMNHNNCMSDGEPVYSRLGDMQPALRQQQMIHDPGDLRYDLERRRQERLGEVKVTIPGGSMSQRPLAHRSERVEEFVDGMDMMQQEVWSRHQEQDGRRGGDTRVQRRGDPFLHPGPHERSNHPGNQPQGPMRRLHRNNSNGASW